MKDSLQIALIVFMFAFVGFRIYQRYFKKNIEKTGGIKKRGSPFTSSSKDDDYEPYSNK